MTFDDQLKQAIDGMGERLRAAVDRQVEIVVEEIGAAAQAERERAVSNARDEAAGEAADALATAVAAARQEAREEGLAAGKNQAHNEGLQEGRLKGGEEGRQLGLEDGRRQGLEEGRQQGLSEGRQLGLVEGRQQGLEEGLQGVLEARRAVEQEGRETLQAAVAAARAERVVGPGDTDMLAESVRTIGGARSLKEVLETLVGGASRQSGHANVWIIQSGRLRHWRPNGIDEGEPSMALDAPGPIAAAARTNAVATSEGTLAVPIAMAGQVVAVLYTNAGANGGAIEILARYAARCLEALTAIKAARALTERPGGQDVKAPAAGGESSAEDDASAQRYARLLVSEIKLYHEAEVADGRRDRDLATRLGGEIARARVLYEQGVPPRVRARGDYFHDELVRTLADGDATLLQLT